MSNSTTLLDTISASQAAKHGMNNTGIYHVWENMKARCFNLNNPSYKDYGGRGITVCDRWLKFENFYADMGNQPENLTLDRINNNGNYEKSNCRWATRAQQSDNLRTCRKINFNGKTQSIGAWAREFGLSHGVLWNRIVMLGWDMQRAISQPSRILKGTKNG